MTSTFAPSVLAELTGRLEARRAEATRMAASCRTEASAALDDLDLSDLFDHEAPDAGSSDIDRARALALAAAARDTAGAVEAALERMAEGRYGTCEGCGCRIPLARLRAVPETTVCVDCKQAGGLTGTLLGRRRRGVPPRTSGRHPAGAGAR